MNELIPIELAKSERSFLDSFHWIPPFDAAKAARLFGIPAQMAGDSDGANYSSSHVALEQFRKAIGR